LVAIFIDEPITIIIDPIANFRLGLYTRASAQLPIITHPDAGTSALIVHNLTGGLFPFRRLETGTFILPLQPALANLNPFIGFHFVANISNGAISVLFAP